MQNTFVTTLALAGWATAQAAYGEISSTSASTTYACNPAHSYPGGASCISTAGSLTLVTPAPYPTTTSYACNPAHSYPNGQSCISTAGSLTLVSPSASATAGGSSACYAAYNECRGKANANMATCAAEYAGCLGYNPFANNGTNTVTPAAGGDVYVTEVYTAFTTYCPLATTLTYNSKTYTVSSATTLTITDCGAQGCHRTTPASSIMTKPTVTAVVSSYTTYCPEPTTVTINSQTYTVSSATTLTVSKCPGGCTITTPGSLVPVKETTTPGSQSPVNASTTPSSLVPVKASQTSGYVAPSGYASASGSSGYGNSTVPFTGAGAKVMAGGAFVLTAVAGLIVLF